MKLTLNLSPVRSDVPTDVSLSGTTLLINGVSYDLSELPDGAVAQHPELGVVTRNGDEYECTIRLTHGANAPEATRFPAPIVLNNHNGPVPLPIYNEEPEDVVVE